MEEEEKQQIVAKALRLEGKLLFVKAAAYYLEAGMEEKAAAAYEKGGSYDRAIGLYRRLGKSEDASRCERLRDKALSGSTFQSVQAEFQQDKGNPY